MRHVLLPRQHGWSVVTLPLRDRFKEPGDVIAADVIGPYNKSVNRSQYILTVQDLASGLVLAIPLRTKGGGNSSIDPVDWPVYHTFEVDCQACADG